MAIEVDGGYYKERKNIDEVRDQFLSYINIETLRISDKEIENDLNILKSKIERFIEFREISLFKGKTPKGKGFK